MSTVLSFAGTQAQSLWQPGFPSFVQTNGENSHTCKHQTPLCGDGMRMWRSNDSPDEWSWWLERRAGDEKQGRGERWMVAVGKVTAKLQVLFWLFMSSRRLTPLPPPSPLLLHSPLPLASALFQYFISATQSHPCPLRGLWLPPPLVLCCLYHCFKEAH